MLLQKAEVIGLIEGCHNRRVHSLRQNKLHTHFHSDLRALCASHIYNVYFIVYPRGIQCASSLGIGVGQLQQQIIEYQQPSVGLFAISNT